MVYKTYIFKLFIFISLESFLIGSIASKKIPIKIVKEVPYTDNNLDSYSINGFESDASGIINKGKKGVSVLNPAPFSGPEQLKELDGLCFSHLDEKYKYRLCPFKNVTQEEVQSLQEPYKGILGVWGEWIIKNNTFAGLHFLQGAKCGIGKERSVKVYLKCGVSNRLISIKEPSKCLYDGTFETPLVCGKNALVVYPRLPKELQVEWDRIETEKHFQILTQKGYEIELREVFLKAGYLISPDLKEKLSFQVNDDNESECDDALRSLKLRVLQLEKEIKLKNSIIKSLTND